MNRPIRVLYLVPDLRVGGAERHVTTLMPHLDRGRFTPSVLCIGEEGELFGELAAAGVPARALHRTKRQAVRALWDIARVLRRERPDVVITRGYNAEGLGRVAAWLTRVPNSVVWVHNHGDVEPRGRARELADRVLDRCTAAYFGVANAQIDYMTGELGYPREKIRIIHNGVDPALYETSDDRGAIADLGIGADEPVVAIVAALRPEKDHETFLRAARRVVDTVPEARFLIVGDGPERGRIEALTRELDIGDRVVLAGSRPDVADVLRAVQVVVLSSHSVECFPMAVLEAMAAGRPAVCTAVGGVLEMVEDGVTGYLVPPRDPNALADKLIAVLTDEPLRRRMGAAARVRVETEFSSKTSITAAERAVEEVVRRG
ncbi:glycosyltransferase [Nocardia sp. CDC153]|uniref:glycosyltransferase n=1 Tax=Nocardia sp. CDC153 TaxID=3112167 RepID=UPI002DBE5B91|nr:glycosyltransferase [Nocardia sp. CDC153]MEC3955847.1 glycosyltransferase [Nocardia sp. CDC153]